MKTISASKLSFYNHQFLYKDSKISLFMGENSVSVTADEGIFGEKIDWGDWKLLWKQVFYNWGFNDYLKLGFWSKFETVNSPQIKVFETRDFAKELISSQYSVDRSKYLSQVSFGYCHVGYLTIYGDLILEGLNQQGQLGSSKNEKLDIFGESKAEGERVISIHIDRHTSSALTNSSRMFVWGDNELNHAGNKKNKNTKPIEITNMFKLSNGEKITHYQMVNDSKNVNNHWIFIVNDSFIRTLNQGLVEDITKLFNIEDESRVKKLISKAGTHICIFSSNRSFMWGLNLIDQTLIETPFDLNVVFDLKDDYIVDAALCEDHVTFLTNKGRLFVYGGPKLDSPNSIERWRLKTLHKNLNQISTSYLELTNFIALKENETIKSIACNDYTIGAVTSHNRILIWGSNQVGNYGDRSQKDRAEPYDLALPIVGVDLE